MECDAARRYDLDCPRLLGEERYLDMMECVDYEDDGDGDAERREGVRCYSAEREDLPARDEMGCGPEIPRTGLRKSVVGWIWYSRVGRGELNSPAKEREK